MPLPAGFELEQSQGPKLPAGFQLETPPRQTALQEMQPAISGALKLGTGVAGMGVDMIENIANLGIAGYGLARGAITGDPGASPELMRGSVGGSEHLASLLRKTGSPVLNPDNPMPNDALAKAQYDFMARGGAIPGGAVPAIGSQIAEKIGGPAWAPVGAMLPSAAKMAYNEMRAPALAAEQAKNQVRDQTLKAAQDEGLKVIPTQIESSQGKAALESLGGKAAIKQQLTIDNQKIATSIARREVGLPENAQLTVKALEARRGELSQPFAELAAVSPKAEYFLRDLRDARQKATAFWKEYEVQKTVSSLEKYRAFDKKASILEGQLEKEAARVGKPELVPAMREARQAMAKTWDVQRALNVGDGNIDTHALGRMYDHGAPLSGGLETLAKFAEGPGRQVTGEISRTPSPGVSKLNYAGSAVLGALGAIGGPAGAAMGVAAPFVAPPIARSVATSDWYQRRAATPNYAPPFKPEGALQSLVRTAILENQAQRSGRQQ